MTLAGALDHHEGALRASLQSEYGLRLLPGGRTRPSRGVNELSDLVAHLPPGCALWREVGGPIALSAESLLLRESVFRLEAVDWHLTQSKGPAPKRVDLPKPAHEVRAEEAKRNAKAAAWAARNARRADRAAHTG